MAERPVYPCDCRQVILDLSDKQVGEVLRCPWCGTRYEIFREPKNADPRECMVLLERLSTFPDQAVPATAFPTEAKRLSGGEAAEAPGESPPEARRNRQLAKAGRLPQTAGSPESEAGELFAECLTPMPPELPPRAEKDQPDSSCRTCGHSPEAGDDPAARAGLFEVFEEGDGEKLLGEGGLPEKPPRTRDGQGEVRRAPRDGRSFAEVRRQVRLAEESRQFRLLKRLLLLLGPLILLFILYNLAVGHYRLADRQWLGLRWSVSSPVTWLIVLFSSAVLGLAGWAAHTYFFVYRRRLREEQAEERAQNASRSRGAEYPRGEDDLPGKAH